MRCPWCGELIPDGALICHRCGNKLGEEEDSPASLPGPGTKAPGEWRAVASTRPETRPPTSKRKSRRMVKAPLVYGLIILAIGLWIGLSLTVWGNPSPRDRSLELYQAISKGDEEIFLACFLEDERDRGRELWKQAQLEYGAVASFRNPEFEVESDDGYEAVIRLVRVTVEGGRLAGREITRQDGIVLVWENRKGRWYLDPIRSRITPS